MPTPFSGGCACGAIRYECNAEPIVMFNCHCRDWQRATGGPFSAVVYVPAKAFKITKGSPRYYKTSSEGGGRNLRGFCPELVRGFSAAEATEDKASTLPVWMTRACFVRGSTSSRRTRSRGIRCTRSCRSLRNILKELATDEHRLARISQA
jgi:hypothetical protein